MAVKGMRFIYHHSFCICNKNVSISGNFPHSLTHYLCLDKFGTLPMFCVYYLPKFGVAVKCLSYLCYVCIHSSSYLL